MFTPKLDDIHKMKGCLDYYARASVQVINFDKFKVCFEKHIEKETMDEIPRVLRVKV